MFLLHIFSLHAKLLNRATRIVMTQLARGLQEYIAATVAMTTRLSSPVSVTAPKASQVPPWDARRDVLEC